MRRHFERGAASILLRFRIHPAPEQRGVDPRSLEYLYLVQQRKRLALAASVGRLRPRNILLFPFIVLSVLLRLADLSIANQIIRSMLNERDLQRRIEASGTTPDR